MSDADRDRWDARYAQRGALSPAAVTIPALFADHESEFPTAGTALDVACGRGGAAVWLARRGLHVLGVDISAVAVGQARGLAAADGVEDRCRFEVADLDHGLPDGRPVDVIVGQRFWTPRLAGDLVERLAPDGLLAISALRADEDGPHPYRVTPAQLRAAFDGLAVVAAGQDDAVCWLLGRRRDGT